MGDLADVDLASSLSISGTMPDPLTKIRNAFLMRYTKKDIDDIHKKLAVLFKNPSHALKGIPFLSTEKDTMLEKIQFVCMLGIFRRELRDEIFCQICKQLTDNPSENSRSGGWILLYLCMACFSPSDFLGSQLFEFLREIKTEESAKCEKVLRGTLVNGTRGFPPSWLEFQAVKNNKPILLPVALMDSKRVLVQVDPATSVNELCRIIAAKLGIQDRAGFSVYITLFSKISCLGSGQQRVMDAISECEQYTKQMGMRESSASWRLYFRKEYFTPWESPATLDDVTAHLVFKQISRGITVGEYKCNTDVELNVIAMKVFLLHTSGEFDENVARKFLTAWLPESYQEVIPEWTNRLMEVCKATEYSDVHPKVLQREVISHALANWATSFSRCYDLTKISGPSFQLSSAMMLINSQGISIVEDEKPHFKLTYLEIFSVNKTSRHVVSIETFKGERYDLVTVLSEDLYQHLNHLMEGLRNQSQFGVIIKACTFHPFLLSTPDHADCFSQNSDKNGHDSWSPSQNSDSTRFSSSQAVQVRSGNDVAHSPSISGGCKTKSQPQSTDFVETDPPSSLMGMHDLCASLPFEQSTKTSKSGGKVNYGCLKPGTLLQFSSGFGKSCANGKVQCQQLGKEAMGVVDVSKVHVVLVSGTPSEAILLKISAFFNADKSSSGGKLSKLNGNFEEYAKKNFKRRGSERAIHILLSKASLVRRSSLHFWDHTIDCIHEPLLKSLSKRPSLIRAACISFKAMMQFSEDSQTSNKYDEDTLINSFIIEPAIKSAALRDEIYCQILKQLSNNYNTRSQAKYWQIFVLLASTCIPSCTVFQVSVDFCRQSGHNMGAVVKERLTALQRGGNRRFPPHRLEFFALQTEACTIPTTVHLPNAITTSVDVTSTTLCHDLLRNILSSLSLPMSQEYGLYYLVPSQNYSVPENAYLFDFLKSIETIPTICLSTKSTTLNLTMRKKLWFNATPGENKVADTVFHFYQELPNYLRGYHEYQASSVSVLASYIFIARFGQRSSERLSTLGGLLNELVPQPILATVDRTECIKDIESAIKLNLSLTPVAAQLNFLIYLSKLKTYASEFFEAETTDENLPRSVTLAINPTGVLLINKANREIVDIYPFAKIPNWHFSTSSFTILIGDSSNTTKIILKTTSGQQIDSLIMDYIVWLMNYHMSLKRSEAGATGESDC